MANLTNANLTNANLTNTNLTNPNLTPGTVAWRHTICPSGTESGHCARGRFSKPRGQRH